MNQHLAAMISRKWIAFIVATVFLPLHWINEQTWLIIVGAYLTANLIETGIKRP